MQSSSEQPLVGEEHCVTTLITAAKETTHGWVSIQPSQPKKAILATRKAENVKLR